MSIEVVSIRTGGENAMTPRVSQEVIDHDPQRVHDWRVTVPSHPIWSQSNTLTCGDQIQ